LGRASLRSQSLTSGKTNAPSCNLALNCPCNPFLHSTYRCGLWEASRHTNQTRTRLYTIQILARSFVNVHKRYDSEKPLPLQKILHSCSREEIADMLTVHCEFRVLGDRFFPSPVSLDSCTVSRSTQLFITLLSLSLPQHLQTNQRPYQHEEDEPKIRHGIRGLRLRAHQGSPRPRLSILRNPAEEVHHGPPTGANTSSSSRKRCRNQWTSDISDDCSGDIQEWSYDMMWFVRHVRSLLCSRS
jgi:hypothetical protein